MDVRSWTAGLSWIRCEDWHDDGQFSDSKGILRRFPRHDQVPPSVCRLNYGEEQVLSTQILPPNATDQVGNRWCCSGR